MIKICALLILISTATAALSQDRKGQLDSLCNQFIVVLQNATETDSIKVDLFSGHMGFNSKLEIRITKLRDFFKVECLTGHESVNGPFDLRTHKFKTKLDTVYQIRHEKLISNLREKMKLAKTRTLFLPDYYFVKLDANAKSQEFSLAYGSGFGLVMLFSRNMLDK